MQVHRSAEHDLDPEQDGTVVVPAGKYFVMGDNRTEQSFDSRVWGFVDEDQIIGRAFVIIWPQGQWTLAVAPRALGRYGPEPISAR